MTDLFKAAQNNAWNNNPSMGVDTSGGLQKNPRIVKLVSDSNGEPISFLTVPYNPASGATGQVIADPISGNKVSARTPADTNGGAVALVTEDDQMFWDRINNVWARATAQNGIFHNVSPIATAQAFIFDITGCTQGISIVSTGSAGTYTLIVDVDPTNAFTGNQITIDSVAAAASQLKYYAPTTVGGTTAVSPFTCRFVRVTLGSAGAGNTTTLTVMIR